jgi:chromosome partitioning protein
MARKVALINMKGGVGKSTLCVNLAWHFALPRDSKRVLVVDLDPQFNASQYLLGTAEYERQLRANNPTIWDIFERNTRTPHTPGQPFDVRTAIYNRMTERSGAGRLDVILSRLELAFSLKTPFQEKERELSRALAELEDAYDLILIDCAPTESILTTAAYFCSDFLLVPVKPEYLSAIGLPLLVQSMRAFQDAHVTHSLQLAGVVFNATTEYSPEEMLAKSEVRQIASRNDWHVFDNEVSYSRSYAKGARLGASIYGTPHTRKQQRRRFSAFAQEFAKRIGL